MTESLRFNLPQADLDHVVQSVGNRWQTLAGQTWLLTGGTGFIGKWLLASFLHANQTRSLQSQVLVLTRNPDAFCRQHPELALNPTVQLVAGDVRSFELPSGLRVAHVIHAATDVVAAATPSQIFDTCVQGTRQVLAQMQRSGTQRMLLLSSGAVYGATPPELECIPEDWLGAPSSVLPSSAYGEGKRASELLCAMAAAEHGFCIPVARCFAFVGPYLPLDKHFAIGNFIGAALRNQTVQIQGDGTACRSYLYAADLALWLWVLLFDGQSLRTYNVGGGESSSIAELARRVVSVLGASSPVHIAKQAAPGAPVHRYLPDIQRITHELELPEALSLDEAIRRTAQWYQARADFFDIF